MVLDGEDDEDDDEGGVCDVAGGDTSSEGAPTLSCWVETAGAGELIRWRISCIDVLPWEAVLAASPSSKFAPLHEELSEYDGCEEGGVGYGCEAMLDGKTWLEARPSFSKGIGRWQSDTLRAQHNDFWQRLGCCFSEEVGECLWAGRSGC